MVIKETVYDAFINWNMRMTKLLLCFDVVRAEVPKLKLDDVLKEKMISQLR
jgi:hypothetical protein